MPSLAEIKTQWQRGFALAGTRVTVRRGSSQATDVRARITMMGAGTDMEAGAVEMVDFQGVFFADDMAVLGPLRQGDKIGFEGRTYTVDRADITSGRFMGERVVDYAVLKGS